MNKNARCIIFIAYLILTSASTGASTAKAERSVLATGPELTIRESSTEIRNQLKDDLPYSRFIRTIINECDSRYLNNTDEREVSWSKHIYWGLVDLLRGKAGFNGSSDQARYTGDYAELLVISRFLEELKLSAEVREFHELVFVGDIFTKSSSEYNPIVKDLIKKLGEAKSEIPYGFLLHLNFPGRKIDTTQWYNGMEKLGGLYESLGEYETAIVWYSKLPSDRALGDLKIADAYFAWGKLEEAESRYKLLLNSLNSYEKLRNEILRTTALAEPLEMTSNETIQMHIKTKLREIERKKEH